MLTSNGINEGSWSKLDGKGFPNEASILAFVGSP
jgi:hypothetical protein